MAKRASWRRVQVYYPEVSQDRGVASVAERCATFCICRRGPALRFCDGLVRDFNCAKVERVLQTDKRDRLNLHCGVTSPQDIYRSTSKQDTLQFVNTNS